MPQVLNARYVGKHSSSRQYVGRPSCWGNPFIIGRDGTREQVIAKYLDWLYDQDYLLEQIHELRGKDLVCWCAPEACHADILIEIANDPLFYE